MFAVVPDTSPPTIRAFPPFSSTAAAFSRNVSMEPVGTQLFVSGWKISAAFVGSGRLFLHIASCNQHRSVFQRHADVVRARREHPSGGCHRSISFEVFRCGQGSRYSHADG